MFDYDEIAIEVPPGRVLRFFVWSRKDNRPICRGVDGGSAWVRKFDAVMGVTRPIGGGAIPIDRIDEIISGRLDRALKDEMTVGDAILFSERIAGRFGCTCYRWRDGWGGSGSSGCKCDCRCSGGHPRR